MKTALVIGATGLVGSQLVRFLLSDENFSKVIVFGRRTVNIDHPRLKEHLIDFEKPESWRHLVKGDVFFSTLGTTIKQAGSKAAQYKIDHSFQYRFAEAAAGNKVPVYVLVSAASANPQSGIFYTRMKGELERDVKQLPFQSINLIQPGLLVGKRKQERLAEKAGYKVLTALNKMGLFKNYRPVHDHVVAQAMINAGLTGQQGVHVYKLEEVFDLAAR